MVQTGMFHKVVVANRRAAAARVIRALRELGVRSVALYSDADRDAPYLAEADEAVRIGPAPAGASYLNRDAVIAAALAVRADAVHPGYGFLAEDATFAERVEREVGRFIGPSPGWIARMGHKPSARALMAEHGIPVGGGSGPLADDEAALFSAAERVGFPLIVKPASGGGGIGMVVARHPGELAAAARRARSTVRRAFGNDSIYLERLVGSINSLLHPEIAVFEFIHILSISFIQRAQGDRKPVGTQVCFGKIFGHSACAFRHIPYPAVHAFILNVFGIQYRFFIICQILQHKELVKIFIGITGRIQIE